MVSSVLEFLFCFVIFVPSIAMFGVGMWRWIDGLGGGSGAATTRHALDGSSSRGGPSDTNQCQVKRILVQGCHSLQSRALVLGQRPRLGLGARTLAGVAHDVVVIEYHHQVAPQSQRSCQKGCYRATTTTSYSSSRPSCPNVCRCHFHWRCRVSTQTGGTQPF